MDYTIAKKFSIYRHIQLLTIICNNIRQKVMLTAGMVGSIITAGTGLAVIIRTPCTPDSLPVILVMGLLSLNTCLFMLFCLGEMAELYMVSKQACKNIKLIIPSVSSQRTRKLTGSYLRSCGPLRSKFGGNNFVEELTPLNCMSHAFQLAVQILLLG